ncbi:MAG: PorV/PorQ family protein [Bacteroidales bacterium]|nr:PorV/PorQ family protein [Bacteroidales bacterium]
MKKLFFTTILIAALGMNALAQEMGAAMPFVSIDRNPATSAMAGTQTTSALFNTAAVPFSSGDVVFSFQNWAPGKEKHFNLMAALPFSKSFGLYAIGAYQAGQAYTVYTETGIDKGSFTPSDILAGLGMGIAFSEHLSMGVKGVFVMQTLADDAKYNAFYADAFLLYHSAKVNASAGISAIGSKVKSGDNAYSLPAVIKAGADYTPIEGLKLALDADYYLNLGFAASIGAEYAYKDMIFARAGYHIGTGKTPIPSHLGLGAGFKWKGIHLDVSFLTASQTLGNTLNLGLGYSF